MLNKLFKKSDSTGHFEALCLTAVHELGDEAYGIAVHEKVEELANRQYLLPASYVTLDRLEDKGYLKSSFTSPTPERGGRRKRCFQLTPAGEHALKESAETSKRMYDSWSTAQCPAQPKPRKNKNKI